MDIKGDGAVKQVKSTLSSMNKELQTSNSILKTFQNTFNAVMGISFMGIGISSVTGLIDSMQKLQDRITIINGSTAVTESVMERLRISANYTKTGIDELASTYARFSYALKDIGLTSNSTIALVTSLRNMYRLSGATTEEATGSTIQLTQALAQNGLQGQELRSVLQNNVVLSEALARSMGKTRGELRKIAEKDGGIAAKEVLKAVALVMDDVNGQAEKLRPTIGESLTTAFNDLKLSVMKMNDEFAITDKVASGIKVVSDNLNTLVGIAAGASALYIIPKIFAGISLALEGIATYAIIAKMSFIALGEVLAGIVAVLGGPLTVVIGTVGLLIYQLVERGIGWANVFRTIRDNILDAFPALDGLVQKLGLVNSKEVRNFVPTVDKTVIAKAAQDTISTFNQELNNPANYVEKNNGAGKNLFMESVIGDFKNFKFEKSPIKEVSDQFKKEVESMSNKQKIGSISEQLKKLNEDFNAGKIKVADYNVKLYELTALLNKGKSPKKMFEELNKVLEGNLNRSFEDGTLTLKEYQTAINALELSKLEDGFKKGYIAAEEFHKKIIEIDEKFRGNSALISGTDSYLKKIGTLSQGLASVVETTWGRVEDGFMNFINTGKFGFRQFTYEVLQDLQRIILRSMIIRPLAKGLLSFASADAVQTGTDADFYPQAKGGAWNGGVQFYAKGGVFDSPTMFGRAGGGLGIMGEAGPEAILPLERGAGGRLGVSASVNPVTVNIINQTGADIQQTETTNSDGSKSLDILITAKVKEGLANGYYDRTLQSVYGLNRKGL